MSEVHRFCSIRTLTSGVVHARRQAETTSKLIIGYIYHLIKDKIKKEILNEIQTVDNCRLNGFMKLWLYQFYVLYHFSWPLLIHDLDKSFAVEIQRLINPTLKK